MSECGQQQYNFMIWSFEHCAWWKPNGNGYTTYPDKAGVFSYERAMQIAWDSNRELVMQPGLIPCEAVIPTMRAVT